MDIRRIKRFEINDLPDLKSIVDDANTIASKIVIGETLFMKKHGVKSEGEFKKRMIQAKKIMKHTHIGWNEWSTTKDGFNRVFDELEKVGSYVDRFGVCLDWVMGVPQEFRSRFQAGGGLIFKTQDEWRAIGQVVPVQPHLGDHMIGSLNGVENTVNALEAGVTTIGNLAHYYTYEYPGLDMELHRTIDYIKSIVIMSNFNNEGVIIHSNLDDGYGAQFHDLANLVGWAKLERYIAEDLLDARVSHCYGNLFSDSMLRIIFNRSMSMINKHNTPGSFVNGNTIDYGMNISRNYGALCGYSLADIICQNKYPTGYAVAPVPLTEAIRVPTVEEILEAHHAIDMMIEKASYYEDYINWDKVNYEAENLVEGGNVFFERVLNALDGLGVDINHPGQIAGTLKSIGAEQLEVAFGAGKSDDLAMRGRVPIRPTSIVDTISKIQDDILSKVNYENESPLRGVNIVLGSTDVHEFGKEVVKNVLAKAGANIFDLGTTVSVHEIADTLIETGSKVVLISTYNGIALSFGRELLCCLKEANLNDIQVIMGGRLNEPIGDNDLPVDVTKLLNEIGINTDNDVEKLVTTIQSFKQ